MNAAIQDFPAELVIQILTNLDHIHVLRCAAVCKFFNAIIQGSHKLRYKIELAFDGLIDLPQSKPSPTHEKLQLLLSRRDAWRKLDWKHKYRVPMSGSCRAYELVSGIFAKSTGTNSVHGSRHFIMSTLPSRRHPSFQFIVRDDVGVPSKDFVIDPTQDLIGYVSENGIFPQSQIQIHLMTISSHKPHPEAVHPVINRTCNLPFVMTNSFIAIAEDVLAIFFWIENPGLIIWNWKSGNLLAYVTGGDNLPPGIWDFSFISNRAFILTSRDLGGSIEIYSFRDPPNPPTEPVLAHVASLHLPALKPMIIPALFSTHSGPFTTSHSSSESYGTSEEKPFAISKHSRIHAMCVQYHIIGGTIDRRFRFFFFVRNDFFLKLVDEHQSGGAPQATPPRLLPWQDWGVDNTRFMADGMQPRWLRYVHGLKVVCPPYPDDQNRWRYVLDVFDFNVHPKKLPEDGNTTWNSTDPDHERANDSNSGTPRSSSSLLSTRPSTSSSSSSITHEVSYTVHTEPSFVPASDVFISDVVSKLPYTHTVRKDLCAVYSGFMIDDERLIGLKASPDGEMGDIDVFVL